MAHLLGWICYSFALWRTTSDQVRSVPSSNERMPLIASSTPQRKLKMGCWHCGSCNQHCSRVMVAKLTSLLIVVFGIAYTVAGSFVTTVPTDKSALSGSSKCGLWGLRDTAPAAVQDKDALSRGQKETRSGQYAKACYGAQAATSLDQCLLFEEPFVSTSSVELEQQCPFTNDTFCIGNAAVKFTTGLVDARVIGIRAQNGPKFRRSMICTPLNIYQGFVEKTSDQRGHWAYDLGPVNSEEYSSPYTFRQYGDPFDWDVRSYTMRSVNAIANRWR